MFKVFFWPQDLFKWIRSAILSRIHLSRGPDLKYGFQILILFECFFTHVSTLQANSIFSEEGNLNYESVINMQYTQQVLEETLRLYPPVWLFSRKSINDDNLGKYDIPVNSDLYLSPYILHRSREFWSNPEKFDPDRFDKTPKAEKNNNAFIPFSLGPRRCLGEYFSFLEMKIHLGYLINKFKIKKSHSEDPGLNLGINLRSKNDIFLEFKPR